MVREAWCGSPGDECALKTLLLAVAGVALLLLIMLVGLYTYTDTSLP